jgi:hypothetical protein
MDDCNKAIEIARSKSSVGVEKGEFFANLFVKGKTRYEDALAIAVRVSRLCDKKIEEIKAVEDPLKAKIAGAGAADKKEDKLTGVSNLNKWKDDLESNEQETRFYKMILKNAADVSGMAKKGIKNVGALKSKVQNLKDISDYQIKLTSLIDDAITVLGDAELLWQQWLDSGKDYNCGAPPAVEHTAKMCELKHWLSSLVLQWRLLL